MKTACPICKTQINTEDLVNNSFPYIKEENDYSVEMFDGICKNCKKALTLSYYSFNEAIIAWSRKYEMESVPENFGDYSKIGTALYIYKEIENMKNIFDHFKSDFYKKCYVITHSENRELIKMSRLSYTPIVIFNQKLFEYSDIYHIPNIFIERIIASMAQETYTVNDTYLPIFKRYQIDNSTH